MRVCQPGAPRAGPGPPISDEAARSGDAFARSHPEIDVVRYRVPRFFHAGDAATFAALVQLESDRLHESLPAIIARERPDVILIGREYLALPIVPVARTHGIPSVVRAAGITTLGLLNGIYPGDLAGRILEQLGLAGQIVAVAHYQASELRSLGLRAIRVILNAVDLQQFRPGVKSAVLQRTLAVDSHCTVAAYVGNLHARKRPLDIVAAAEHARKRNARLLFLVAGDGELRGEMQAACERRGLAEHFRFVGWVEHTRVPDYIRLADIVILPSEGEGLARVYLETQACERVLVASDIRAAREVIEHSQTGLLFRKGDTRDMADQLVWAAEHPEGRAEIGRQARRRVERHSLDRVVLEYLSLFESMAGCRP